MELRNRKHRERIISRAWGKSVITTKIASTDLYSRWTTAARNEKWNLHKPRGENIVPNENRGIPVADGREIPDRVPYTLQRT